MCGSGLGFDILCWYSCTHQRLPVFDWHMFAVLGSVHSGDTAGRFQGIGVAVVLTKMGVVKNTWGVCLGSEGYRNGPACTSHSSAASSL